MSPAEPAPQLRVDHPWFSRVLAARPPFLLASVVPVLLGISSAWHGGVPLRWPMAIITLVAAVLLHAAVNLLNDYYDARNGSDAANVLRVFPFTGGSRFIQNGVFTERDIGWQGAATLLITILLGVWLLWHLPVPARAGLGLLGVTGVLLGWAYSAPPLALNSKGLGELSVAIGFLLLVMGSDYVQRQGWAWLPVIAGVSYALLVTNLLWINQFPDCQADAGSGKRHWVVRLGTDRARWVYIVLVVASYAWLGLMVFTGYLPVLCLLAGFALPLSLWAARCLWLCAAQPQQLAPAIGATIAAMLLHGLLLAAGLFWG